jgi:kynurenine formamidase
LVLKIALLSSRDEAARRPRRATLRRDAAKPLASHHYGLPSMRARRDVPRRPFSRTRSTNVKRSLWYLVLACAATLVAAGLMNTRQAVPAEARGGAGGPLPGFSRALFLGHVNDPAVTPLFPGDPEFRITTSFTIPEDGFYLNYVQEGEHTGTHYSAPCHFNEGERCADQLDAADFFRPAVVIDVRFKAARDADYEITVADVQRFERANGRIPRGAAVLGLTGWDRRWGTPAYPNADADGNLHQPGFSFEAATWLLDNRGIGVLGTDTFSPEAATDAEFRVSSLMLAEHRLVLENLANLERMPATGGWIVVGGPRNARGSGAPSTVFGLVPAR